MKTIKTALISRKIDDLKPEIIIFHVREVLTEYRKALINRLILDLPTYVDYKFTKRPGKEKLDEIREMLYAIKNSSVDLTSYDPIVKEVLANDHTFIKTELIYKEIDENIGEHLREGQIIFTPVTT